MAWFFTLQIDFQPILAFQRPVHSHYKYTTSMHHFSSQIIRPYPTSFDHHLPTTHELLTMVDVTPSKRKRSLTFDDLDRDTQMNIMWLVAISSVKNFRTVVLMYESIFFLSFYVSLISYIFLYSLFLFSFGLYSKIQTLQRHCQAT